MPRRCLVWNHEQSSLQYTPFIFHLVLLLLLVVCVAISKLVAHGSIKHGHCSHALEEDAPKVLGHDSISKWAIWARTERQTLCYLQNGGTEFYVGIRSFLQRHWMGGGG